MPGTSLRRWSWIDTAPWLLLLEAPTKALRPSAMLLVAAGMLTVAGGDALLGRSSSAPQPWQALQFDELTLLDLPAPAQLPVRQAHAAWQEMVEPFAELAPTSRGTSHPWRNALRGLARIAIWGLVGGAVLRMAVLDFTRGEHPSLLAALRYAWQQKSGFWGGLLLLVIGAAVVALPLWFVQLLLAVPAVSLVAAVAWPLVLIAAAVAAFYLIGVAVGWPLVPATIATEKSDSFDGASRMFAYVYQRPLPLIGYLVVASLLGLLFGWIVEFLVAVTLDASRFAADYAHSGPDGWAPSMIAWWEGWAAQIPQVFFTSYLWTAAAAIYLLRRREIDGAELDEVWLAEPSPEDTPPPHQKSLNQ